MIPELQRPEYLPELQSLERFFPGIFLYLPAFIFNPGLKRFIFNVSLYMHVRRINTLKDDYS